MWMIPLFAGILYLIHMWLKKIIGYPSWLRWVLGLTLGFIGAGLMGGLIGSLSRLIANMVPNSTFLFGTNGPTAESLAFIGIDGISPFGFREDIVNGIIKISTRLTQLYILSRAIPHIHFKWYYGVAILMVIDSVWTIFLGYYVREPFVIATIVLYCFYQYSIWKEILAEESYVKIVSNIPSK